MPGKRAKPITPTTVMECFEEVRAQKLGMLESHLRRRIQGVKNPSQNLSEAAVLQEVISVIGMCSQLLVDFNAHVTRNPNQFVTKMDFDLKFMRLANKIERLSEDADKAKEDWDEAKEDYTKAIQARDEAEQQKVQAKQAKAQARQQSKQTKTQARQQAKQNRTQARQQAKSARRQNRQRGRGPRP